MSFAVEGSIDCGGFEHRLRVEDGVLRALDHEGEAAQVFDVLAGASPCSVVVGVWQRLVLSPDEGSLHDQWGYESMLALMPGGEDERLHVAQEVKVRQEPQQLAQAIAIITSQLTDADVAMFERRWRSADDKARLLELPDDLRCAAVMAWVGRALDSGVLRDPEGGLRSVLDQCWESFALEGLPSVSSRRLLVQHVRSQRWA